MGADYGQMTRALVSFDAVLVGALVESLRAEPSETSACRCPINPTVFRPTLAHDSVPMRFAAATQVLLADQWVADKAAEGSRTAQLLRPLGSRTVRRAADALSALGASPEQIARFELEQLVVESSGAADAAQAAAPTAAALAMVFSWTAELPGAVPLDDPARDALSDLGGAVGRAIYGIDALDDLDDDLSSGAFNPCISSGRIEPARLSACVQLVEDARRQIAGALEAVPWARDAELLQNILVERLGQQARAAVRKARALPTVPLSRWQRLLAWLTAAWAMLTAGGGGGGTSDEWDEVIDEQQEKKKRRRKKQRGGGDGGGGSSSRSESSCFDGLCCVECSCDLCGDLCGGLSDCDLPGPCDLDCCPCDGDGCGCEPDCCCACDC